MDIDELGFVDSHINMENDSTEALLELERIQEMNNDQEITENACYGKKQV